MSNGVWAKRTLACSITLGLVLGTAVVPPISHSAQIAVADPTSGLTPEEEQELTEAIALFRKLMIDLDTFYSKNRQWYERDESSEYYYLVGLGGNLESEMGYRPVSLGQVTYIIDRINAHFADIEAKLPQRKYDEASRRLRADITDFENQLTYYLDYLDSNDIDTAEAAIEHGDEVQKNPNSTLEELQAEIVAVDTQMYAMMYRADEVRSHLMPALKLEIEDLFSQIKALFEEKKAAFTTEEQETFTVDYDYTLNSYKDGQYPSYRDLLKLRDELVAVRIYLEGITFPQPQEAPSAPVQNAKALPKAGDVSQIPLLTAFVGSALSAAALLSKKVRK